MTRSSALVLALAITAFSVTGFLAPISGPSETFGTRSKGKSCNAWSQREEEGDIDAVEEESGRSLLSLASGIKGLLGSFDDIPTLPQNPDVNDRERHEQILQAQALYRWNLEYNPIGIPYLDGFPPIEQDPTLMWIIQVADVAAKTLLGVIRNASIGLTNIALALVNSEDMNIILRRIIEGMQEEQAQIRPKDLQSYIDLHNAPIKMPESVYDYANDATFARMRLQGPNCVTIKKCTQAIREKLTILDTDNADYVELKDKVDSLLAAGKLVVVDQEMLKGQEPQQLHGNDDINRYVSCGIALFEVTDNEWLPIRPIAIQLSQGDEATPIFTPDDDVNLWMIAKTCFEASEFTIHEVLSHLGRTHLVVEGALVGMYRNFAKEHPIHVLMQPHLEGTAFINWAAQSSLIEVGGGVDQLLGNTIENCWDLALEQIPPLLSSDFSPEADFKSRSMTKDEFPGRYMYRDFGMRYWDATHTWVTEYLKIYYKSDDDVEHDTELMAFVEEMMTVGKVTWLEEFSPSDDKIAFIAKVIATYIYSASTLHAAVNFPQQSIMSYNPAMPAAIYQPPPTDKESRTEQQYLDYLPPMQIASLQVILTTLLGSVYHTKLGDYNYYQFSDPAVQGPLATFQDTIEEIKIDLEYENSQIVHAAIESGEDAKVATNFAYRTLLPENIPQSINI